MPLEWIIDERNSVTGPGKAVFRAIFLTAPTSTTPTTPTPAPVLVQLIIAVTVRVQFRCGRDRRGDHGFCVAVLAPAVSATPTAPAAAAIGLFFPARLP
jgi:hypothetical protein